MSSYTMTVEELVEMMTRNEHYDTISKIEAGRKKLFNFHYPFFDESKRADFETHFLRHFWMREIGFETEGAFKFHLETWLQINMPFFNKLFESELVEYDPLINMDLRTTRDKENERDQSDNRDTTMNSTTSGTSESTNDANSKENTKNDGNSTGEISDDQFSRQLDSDNPDSRLAITTNDGSGVIQYATGIKEQTEKDKRTSKDNQSSTGERTSTDSAKANSKANSASDGSQKDIFKSDVDEKEHFHEHIIGNHGVKTSQEMIVLWRQAFIRIEKMIFEEMQPLFMGVY